MRCPIASRANSQSIALVTDACALSYAELDALVSASVIKLKKAGVKEKMRVAFPAHSSLQTLILLFAILRLQAAACPISFRLPVEGVKKILDLTRPHFFVRDEVISHCGGEKCEKDFALLISTSGSSGTPKIACLSYENVHASQEGSMRALPLTQEDRWLLTLPLFHVGGLLILFRAFFSGLSVALSNLSIDAAARKYQATFLSLVPTQLYRRLQTGLPNLKGVLMGGAPVCPELFQEAQKKGVRLFTSYGMTETCSQVTLDLSPVLEGNFLTSGNSLPHREFRLADDGEILVRGKTLFQGYWNRDELLLPLDPEGWFATKDRGRLSKDGRLIVLGRKDTLMISGGENIYPEEIEAALLALPKIIEAVVVPIPDPEFGQRPVAFIASIESFLEDELVAKLRERLPGYMMPRRILAFPEEAGFKRSREALARRAEALLTV